MSKNAEFTEPQGYSKSVSEYISKQKQISPEDTKQISDFFEFDLSIKARDKDFSISDYLKARIPDFLASISNEPANKINQLVIHPEVDSLIKNYLKENFDDIDLRENNGKDKYKSLINLILSILEIGQNENLITENESFQDHINEKIKDVLQRIALLGIPLEKLENLSDNQLFYIEAIRNTGNFDKEETLDLIYQIANKNIIPGADAVESGDFTGAVITAGSLDPATKGHKFMVDQMFRLARDTWMEETLEVIANHLNIDLSNLTTDSELNISLIEANTIEEKSKIIQNEKLKLKKLLPLLEQLQIRKKAIEEGSDYPESYEENLDNLQKVAQEMDSFKDILNELPEELKDKLPKLKTPGILVVKSTSKSEKYQLFKLIERANILRKYGINIPIILGEGIVQDEDIQKTKENLEKYKETLENTEEIDFVNNTLNDKAKLTTLTSKTKTEFTNGMIQGNAGFVIKGYRDQEDLEHTASLFPKYKKYNKNISKETFKSIRSIEKLLEVSSGSLKAVFANYYIENNFKFDGIEKSTEFLELVEFAPTSVLNKTKLGIVEKVDEVWINIVSKLEDITNEKFYKDINGDGIIDEKDLSEEFIEKCVKAETVKYTLKDNNSRTQTINLAEKLVQEARPGESYKTINKSLINSKINLLEFLDKLKITGLYSGDSNKLDIKEIDKLNDKLSEIFNSVCETISREIINEEDKKIIAEKITNALINKEEIQNLLGSTLNNLKDELSEMVRRLTISSSDTYDKKESKTPTPKELYAKNLKTFMVNNLIKEYNAA